MLKQVTEAEGLEGWQQSKITKASDYISSVYHSLDYEMKFGEEEVAEGKRHKSLHSRAIRAAKKEEVEEGKSPHKKGTKAYKKHMAAMHAESTTDPYKARLHSRLSERKLTKGEEKEREKNVKGMKKNKADFKKRYGKDAESVMYATATKNAKKKTSESLNRQAKKLLGEGKEYQIYLQLSEAPISDVVNKIKTGLSKLPKNVATKATDLIKKTPKSALPAAAAVITTMLGADPAAADAILSMDMEVARSGLEKLGNIAANFSAAAGDTAQGAAEVTLDQLRSLSRELGGGSATTLTDLIQNGVDIDVVKNILTRFGVTDSVKIEQALQQIDGDNLKPMIDWLGRNR